MSNDHAGTVRRYDEAWAERDSAARQAMLAEIWAEDGIYVDPEVPDGVQGSDALSDLIDLSNEEMPGLTIEATSAPVFLGGRGWYSWHATTGDGEDFDGIDFIEFAADGRIQRLTNFYDA